MGVPMSYPLRGTAVRTETRIDEIMAGFIVWLARQEVSPGRRCRYRRYAERYLRWQTEHPEQAEDRYCDELRGYGIAEPEIRIVGASIALLRRYLIAETEARVS
jgi:hypothetical protein